MNRSQKLLQVRELRVAQHHGKGEAEISLLNGIDIDLEAGQAMALMGPSGCGKSLTARALLGLLPNDLTWSGEMTWAGQRLLNPAGSDWTAVRGRGIGLVLQEPATSLNPVISVGEQIAEILRVHQSLSRSAARARAIELLHETQVPQPERVVHQYAHQLSGGMRQRVLLAAAISSQPQLLIADEPTTSLDVSIQKEILALILRLGRDRNMALLFITHDPDVAALMAEQVAVMSEGKIVERLPASAIKKQELVLDRSDAVDDVTPVLEAKNLVVQYDTDRAPIVKGVDFQLWPGQAVGLLGESGCGKTSLARSLAGHLRAAGGTVTLGGQEVRWPIAANQRRRVQMLFQDPGSSLDPRQKVGAALAEAAGHTGQSPTKLLAEVGLTADFSDRYPHQMSGGQRQRVALARCLAAKPEVLIADEPTSALDGPAQNVVLALLTEIMANRGLAVMLISHNAEVVQAFCHRVMVMKGGLIIEVQSSGQNFQPLHPHTQQMLRAVPRILRSNPEFWLAGQAGSEADSFLPTQGCPHFGGCPLQKPYCGNELPDLKRLASGVYLRCPEAEVTGLSHFIDT